VTHNAECAEPIGAQEHGDEHGDEQQESKNTFGMTLTTDHCANRDSNDETVLD
jgi:hypothetical protein